VPLTDAGKRLELLRVLGRSAEPEGAVDNIILSVGQAIIEGELLPGADLNSVELARRFSTSRTPVREALGVLEREGLVEIPPRRRPRVAELSMQQVREIYVVRQTLYGLVSELVVVHATDEDLTRLRALQDALEAAAEGDDLEAYFWLNVDFRRAEAEFARNTALAGIVDRLGLRTLQLRHLSLSPAGRLRISARDHAQLLRAYEDRDATLAAAVTQSIVGRGLKAIERMGWPSAEPPPRRA
jgi:DNA-binding GntR family transcriptional regulator